MKKVILILLCCFFLQNAIAQIQNNDSTSLSKKHSKFLVGIGMAPSYCWRENVNTIYGSPGGGNPKYDKPYIGYNFGINCECKFNRTSLNMGVGYSYHSYTWRVRKEYDNGDVDNKQNTHKFFFIKVPAKYSLFLGKKKLWYSSFLIDFGYLFKYDINYHLKLTFPNNPQLNYEQNITDQYLSPQYIFFGGTEIGKTILTSKLFNISTSICFKYSSLIKGTYKPNNKYIGQDTYNIHLLVYSFNLIIYPIIH